ncbi:MAG: hypothetical protein ISR87_14975 [Candidatus Marinimicrobia bacterium]|nr:hypothetical protein [FCB group bacterium]MBL7026744.1 hypothetical protein [Candidatus Neomarinimicrobiota bacterium]
MMRLIEIFSLIAVIGCCSTIAAQDINRIDQSISINEDGSAEFKMDIQVIFADSSQSLNIPSEYVEMSQPVVLLDGGEIGTTATLTYDRTSPVFEIQFEQALLGAHVITLNSEITEYLNWEEAGPAEFKTFNWEVVYTNSIPMTIEACALTVILPDGWNYHRVNGSEPEFKNKDPKPPYTFTQIGGRASVSISRSQMKYMERVAIEFAFKNEQKPHLLIWVGLLLSIPYLYYFRHLVLRKDAEPTIKINNDKESK